MRVAHRYVTMPAGTAARSSRDATPGEFAETMGYARRRPQTRDELLALAEIAWIRELREVLTGLLERGREILSVGSGLAEQEAALHELGYDVVASDILTEELENAARLVPGLRVKRLDILQPPPDAGTYDDVLVTGLDYALDDAELERFFANVRALLRPGGRLIFAHRSRRTPATWLVDRLLAPGLAAAGNLRHRLRRDGLRTVRQFDSFRRRRREVLMVAEPRGFRLGRVRQSGHGVVWERVSLHRLGPLYRPILALDRRIHIANNATVLELLTEEAE